ncbi:hypothetical protein [Alteribacter aurantiacus]|uniref:hypothetical protein n=1 Tax=Alteribacter aurantiacus TaxID=254410 RepID=UPI00047CCDF0|nr:hypothetical protein [Alteribacter aurantiacus]
MAKLSSCCKSTCPSIPFVYGALYGSTDTFPAAILNTPVNFVSSGPSIGLVADPGSNAIIIESFGVYEVNYSITNQNTTVGTGTGVIRYSIYVNGAELLASRCRTANRNQDFFQEDTLAKTILTTLNASDVVTLRPSLIESGSHAYFNPTLVVTKLPS